MNFLEACFFRPAGSHVAAGIAGFTAFVILFRFLWKHKQLVRATEDVFRGDLVREKELAAEEGVVFDDKPIVYKGYAVHSTESWKDFHLIDFKVLSSSSYSMEKSFSLALQPKSLADHDIEVAIKVSSIKFPNGKKILSSKHNFA